MKKKEFSKVVFEVDGKLQLERVGERYELWFTSNAGYIFLARIEAGVIRPTSYLSYPQWFWEKMAFLSGKSVGVLKHE